MRIIWIDLLCFSSASKAVWLCYNQPIDRIHYINMHGYFRPFLGVISRIINKPIVQVLDIVESEQENEGRSLYETIQVRLTEALNSWADSEEVAGKIKPFIERTGFNAAKFKEHLKENAYYLLYRPIEMLVLAGQQAHIEGSVFILKATPMKKLIRQMFGKARVLFYAPLFLSPELIDRREDYYYDKHVNAKYYGGMIRPSGKILRSWLTTSFKALFSRRAKARQAANIGVELIQGRVKLDDINDLYWLKDSGIDHKTIYGIAYEDYDANSLKALARLNIHVGRPVVGRAYFLKTIRAMIGLARSAFSASSSSWLRYEQSRYLLRVRYWESFYRRFGIRLLWSMFDIDPEKLCKAQAIELVAGLYLGSHWSNFPMSRSDNQKCYDVLFTWGKHFIEGRICRPPFMAAIVAGYPSDHYFKQRKHLSAGLRREHEGRFIVSFQDNMIANDLPYSKGMQVALHNMLISLLKRNRELVLLLKPKRRHVYGRVSAQLPELNRLRTQGRVRVYFGETARSKAVPAEIGMASDLVIGLGISTTAAECCFAGTVSFHADLTGFRGNAFGSAGLNKVVFRDIERLKEAVQAQIDGKGMTVEECRKYHERLDPFQDGLAYKRTGFVIKKLQEAFQRGLSREEAVAAANKAYKELLAQKEAVLV